MKKLLLADSIPKHIGTLAGVEKVILRGSYIEEFTEGISSGTIGIAGFDAVLLHVGTNNVSRDNEPQKVLREMGDLIRVLRWRNAKLHIVISGILPRLLDQGTTENTVKTVNKLLATVSRERNVIFIRSYNAFCSSREQTGLKTWLYARDGLHLSSRGSFVLHHMFKVQFSDKNIIQRHDALIHETEEKIKRDRYFGYV